MDRILKSLKNCYFLCLLVNSYNAWTSSLFGSWYFGDWTWAKVRHSSFMRNTYEQLHLNHIFVSRNYPIGIPRGDIAAMFFLFLSIWLQSNVVKNLRYLFHWGICQTFEFVFCIRIIISPEPLSMNHPFIINQRSTMVGLYLKLSRLVQSFII